MLAKLRQRTLWRDMTHKYDYSIRLKSGAREKIELFILLCLLKCACALLCACPAPRFTQYCLIVWLFLYRTLLVLLLPQATDRD